jgi:hypothetical protein
VSWLHRAQLASAAVIPAGMLGAWAFNPDSGVLLHAEVLWRVFGSMAELGVPLLLLLMLAGVVLDACRRDGSRGV